MHVVEVGGQAQRRAIASAGVGIDASTHLGAAEREIDQRFHAHRLGDVEIGIKGHFARPEMRMGLGYVLRAQAEQQLPVLRVPAIFVRARSRDGSSRSHAPRSII